jgi:fibro-slime domain-containing protein
VAWQDHGKLILLALLTACSARSAATSSDEQAANADDGSDDSQSVEEDPDDDGTTDEAGASDPSSSTDVVETLPEGFTPGTVAGGYHVVGALDDAEPSNQPCANVLRAVVRDFTQAHVDFGERKPASWMSPGLYQGQLLAALGADRKPQLDPARTPLDVIEKLDDWYRNVADVNAPYLMELWLAPDPARPGTFVFDMSDFFPIDDFNRWPADAQNGGDLAYGPHNFLFTTELHTSFEYKPGQVFSFRGDDDVFVFVAHQLVVDLGGIHGPVSGSVDLDARGPELGLEIGQVYPLDLFQAERNPNRSNFRIETSLDFKDCQVLLL